MTLVFATHNAHKAREIQQILGTGFEVKTLTDIGCIEDIPETADTLEGNALLKAWHVKNHYGYDCFSEDTGLEVYALNGAPGVHTARYAGEEKDPQANMALLLNNLASAGNRHARFRTVIALVRGGEAVLLEGICEGQIAIEQKGTGGFGYDPIFVPDGYAETFAELGEEVKNNISHRALATRKLIAAIVG
ncbi:MAG: non-canonical purine NTP diphosphatase [Saprospiraceae bacterium]